MDNNYYECKITKKNYASAEKKYNQSKYEEYKYKHNRENLVETAELLQKEVYKLEK